MSFWNCLYLQEEGIGEQLQKTQNKEKYKEKSVMLSLGHRLIFKNVLGTVMCIPNKYPVNINNLIVFNIKRRKKSVFYSQIQMNAKYNLTYCLLCWLVIPSQSHIGEEFHHRQVNNFLGRNPASSLHHAHEVA